MKSIKEIAEILSDDLSRRELGNPYFKDNYETYDLTENNFNKILPFKSKRKISCIDGGNQELLPTPGYSIQLNRVYFNIFKNKKLIPFKSDIPRRIEFLSYTSSILENDELYFKTNLTLENDDYRKYIDFEHDLKVKAVDSDFRLGNQILMERMASMARRFSEWTVAEHIIKSELKEGDIIIKDGSLQTAHINENKYVESVFKEAIDKGVIVTGLSKTSRLPTDTQVPLISAIEKFAKDIDLPFDEWCYYPVAKTKKQNVKYQALIMVVKLNKYAETPFRFEMFEDQAKNIGEEGILDVISAIADFSRDITVPGYPYGLLDAHIWARVRKEEINSYQTMLFSEISKLGLWEDVNSHIKSISMHDKLDEM
ncbi:MAG: DNA double-strand break repair nuclease NurA [Methanobacterium sp.]